MIYAQIKSGNKLHLVYELPSGLSNPVCGIAANNYRMTINVPLGHSCKNYRKRINSKSFDDKKFINAYV